MARLDLYRKGEGQPGGVVRAGYALWALEAAGWPRDETTAGVAHYLAVSQRQRGSWSTQSKRAPSESSDFTATALALRSIQVFGEPDSRTIGSAPHKPADRPQTSGTANPRRAGALRWLEATEPRETEDRVFRLWGLKSAGAAPEALATAVSDSLADPAARRGLESA